MRTPGSSSPRSDLDETPARPAPPSGHPGADGVGALGDLVEGVGLAVVVTDVAGVVRHANPTALRLLAPAEGAHWAALDLPDTFFGLSIDPGCDGRDIERLLRSRAATGRGEVILSGSRRHLAWCARALSGSEEQGAGYMFVIRDVTPERQYEQLKSDFLGTLSHELRTPLTSLRGSLQLVVGRNEGLDTMDRQLLEIGINNAERLIRLVNDLLDIDSLERERLALRMTSVDVRSLLAPAIAAVSDLTEGRGGRVTVQCADQLPHVTADRERLLQVLTNLLRNALMFGPVGSVVTLRVRARRGGVQVDVCDQGPGIPPEEQLLVYERFWRAERNGADAGAGLGLAICRAVIARLGGEIWLDSEPGQGSVFSFSLPATGVAVGDDSPLAEEEGTPSGRVLLVEDDPDTRAVLQTCLEAWGYDVTGVSTGAQAVAAARRDRPSAVVLDLLLPDIDGYDILRIFKNSPEMARVPVLVLSIEAHRELARRLGAAEVLQKPLDLEQVRACLASGLRGSGGQATMPPPAGSGAETLLNGS